MSTKLGVCSYGIWFVVVCVCPRNGWMRCVCAWVRGLIPTCAGLRYARTPAQYVYVSEAMSLVVRALRRKKAGILRANARVPRGRGASDAFLCAYASVYIYI